MCFCSLSAVVMRKNLLYGTIVIVLLLLPTIALSRKFTSDSSTPVSQSEVPRLVFVHLFEWKWDDVAQECETFLGAAGYGAIQLSPAMEHAVLPDRNYPWWQRYQPVSYKIDSRSGDRAQFADMVARCHAAGVRVYADAVINHMTAQPDGVGSAGTSFTEYRYPGLYEPSDFHPCRKDITDYQNHTEVTKCELFGLPDLNTRSDRVRDRIANYLIDLVHLGVTGFRIDAAKHIHTQDLAAILKRVNDAVEPDPYIYQEVIDPGNEAVRKSEYYPNGLVLETQYGRIVGEAFLGLNGQTVSQLENLDDREDLAPNEKAIVFIDNHDKQRGHGGGGTYLTYKNGRLYDLANVFMLAYSYGTPQVMSSYAFSDANQGPPADAQGRTQSIYTNGQANCLVEQAPHSEGWVCEHRHLTIAKMVSFRNAISPDAPVTHWWSNGNNQIAFGRGDQGFVVINRDETSLSHTFQTSLPVGVYCNVITDFSIDSKNCPAEHRITVNETGQVTVTVEGMNAIAIHDHARIK